MIIGAMKVNGIVRRKCEGEKKYKKWNPREHIMP